MKEQPPRHIDIPALAETFVDSFGDVSCEKGIAKVELCVTRRDATSDPAKGIVNSKYPACRLVMTPSMLVRLHTRLTDLLEAMEKEGMITRKGVPPTTETN